MIERPSARLILLDKQDRLFMFKVHQPTVYDPADPHYDPFWIMIGGLVDPGEDYAAAAVREAREETGLSVEGPVRWVWKRERVMQWRERKVKHIEQFFLARAADGTVDTSELDARSPLVERRRDRRLRRALRAEEHRRISQGAAARRAAGRADGDRLTTRLGRVPIRVGLSAFEAEADARQRP